MQEYSSTSLRYRRLVHENPEYNTFLSALMASKTILYIGFSFTDGSVPPLATSAPGLGSRLPQLP